MIKIEVRYKSKKYREEGLQLGFHLFVQTQKFLSIEQVEAIIIYVYENQFQHGRFVEITDEKLLSLTNRIALLGGVWNTSKFIQKCLLFSDFSHVKSFR